MLTLDSPAKINLFLRILQKRPDHYHEIASLFQTLALHDTIQYSISSTDSLTTTDATLPTNADNLILKAANLFRTKTGLRFGLKAHLIKRIPHQAGLGGGSSNAATTLWALNILTKSSIPPLQLASWGAEIGSDIPFFFSQGTAYCTGRGEIVKNIEQQKSSPIVIVKPKVGLSTPLVYKHFNPNNASKIDPEELLKNAIHLNDLESAAFEALPELIDFKNQLLTFGFHTVLMTGSGSAFFCLGDGSIPPTFQPAFLCYTSLLNRSEGNWYNCEKTHCV